MAVSDRGSSAVYIVRHDLVIRPRSARTRRGRLSLLVAGLCLLGNTMCSSNDHTSTTPTSPGQGALPAPSVTTSPITSATHPAPTCYVPICTVELAKPEQGLNTIRNAYSDVLNARSPRSFPPGYCQTEPRGGPCRWIDNAHKPKIYDQFETEDHQPLQTAVVRLEIPGNGQTFVQLGDADRSSLSLVSGRPKETGGMSSSNHTQVYRISNRWLADIIAYRARCADVRVAGNTKLDEECGEPNSAEPGGICKIHVTSQLVASGDKEKRFKYTIGNILVDPEVLKIHKKHMVDAELSSSSFCSK